MNHHHLSRRRFLETTATACVALGAVSTPSLFAAEAGKPAKLGYSPLNQEPFVKATLQTRAYQRIYPPEVLKDWAERTQCPLNDQLCQEAVWFTQTMLLGSRNDMEQIAAAIRKIHTHAADLAKA